MKINLKIIKDYGIFIHLNISARISFNALSFIAYLGICMRMATEIIYKLQIFCDREKDVEYSLEVKWVLCCVY